MDFILTLIMDKTDKAFLAKGYWYQVTPLASIKPEEWIVGIYKKGKHSWVTEHCKGGFKDQSYRICTNIYS